MKQMTNYAINLQLTEMEFDHFITALWDFYHGLDLYLRYYPHEDEGQQELIQDVISQAEGQPHGSVRLSLNWQRLYALKDAVISAIECLDEIPEEAEDGQMQNLKKVLFQIESRM